MVVGDSDILYCDTFISKQRKQLDEVQFVIFGFAPQLLRQSRLRSEHLQSKIIISEMPALSRRKERTILFENLGSSGFAERLIDENALIVSTKDPSGAESAKSTRLYAIAASTVGSAWRNRCKSIEIVRRVTYPRESNNYCQQVQLKLRVANSPPPF